MSQSNQMRIAIIGAGPLGIAAGRELLEKGFSEFTIFEKAAKAGGTWHQHSYPGLACDVWAHSYTFSSAPNPDWTASFVAQPEIEAYLQRCAKNFGLESHMKFNCKIVRAEYQAGKGWLLSNEQGEQFEFDAIINAMGNQHTPVMPDIPGIDDFAGESWHSTNWRHDVDLSGKRVVVVGSAASAVQIVPEVAKIAEHLTVLQRTPNSILPRGRRIYKPWQSWVFRTFPFAMRAVRALQTKMMGFMHQAAMLGHKRMDMFEGMAVDHIKKVVKDKSLHEALTPKSRFGCKRPLVSDDFYPALNRDNVTLIPVGATEVKPEGIVTSEGKLIEADVIVYCTGYKVLDYDRIEVVGDEGQILAEVMAVTPQAYKGILAPGFPNYFMGMGPNAMVLSVTYFSSAETNVAMIVRLLAELRSAGKRTLEVNDKLHASYNDWVMDECRNFSWGAASCTSYYQTPTGASPFLFPGDYKSFKKNRESTQLDEFVVS